MKLLRGLLAAALLVLGQARAHGDMDGSDMDEETKTKQKVFVAFHAVLGSIVVYVTLPLAMAFVAGKQPEKHKVFMTVNACLLFFSTLVAMLQFAEGDSKHAKLAGFCVLCWALQALYGLLKNFLFKTWPLKPHRSFGLFLVALSYMTWTSGVLHVQDSCSAAGALQLCQAHILLGAGLVLIGLAHLYYHEAFASSLELAVVMCFVAVELVVDASITVSQATSPGVYDWVETTKVLHVGAALTWFAAVMAGAIGCKQRYAQGPGFTLGLVLHFFFVLLNSVASNDRARAAKTLHLLALVPIAVARPRLRQGTTAFLCVIAGVAFAASADPIANDALVLDAPAYGAAVFGVGLTLFLIHVLVMRFVVSTTDTPNSESTVFHRAGCAQAAGAACCCLLGGSARDPEANGGSEEYAPVVQQASLEMANGHSDSLADEDVTQAPQPPAKPPKPARA